MQIIVVQQGDNHYLQGVALRKTLFFEGFKNAENLINDSYEESSIHIVAIEDNSVIGTGRLTFVKHKAILSQMTISSEKQRRGIGEKLLNKLIALAQFDSNITHIELSARVSAIPFYRKNNFEVFGDIYPSKKTKVLHQLMIFKNQ